MLNLQTVNFICSTVVDTTTVYSNLSKLFSVQYFELKTVRWILLYVGFCLLKCFYLPQYFYIVDIPKPQIFYFDGLYEVYIWTSWVSGRFFEKCYIGSPIYSYIPKMFQLHCLGVLTWLYKFSLCTTLSSGSEIFSCDEVTYQLFQQHIYMIFPISLCIIGLFVHIY